jgi:hypothetical protein
LVWQPFLKDSWDRNVTLSWTEKQEVNHLSVVFNTFNDV